MNYTYFFFTKGNGESKFLGLLLHAMIPAPFGTAIIFSSIPILLPNVDPSYFLFQNLSTFSPSLALIFRVFIISTTTFHGSIIIYTSVINTTNIILTIHNCLKVMTDRKPLETSTEFNTSRISEKFYGIVRFPRNFSKYRQLQAMVTIINHITFATLPFSMLVALVCCVGFGYILVKLSCTVPILVTIMAIFFLTLFIGIIHALFPVIVEVAVKSEKFLEISKLQNVSKYRKKQLQSCRLLKMSIGPFCSATKGIRIQCLSFALYHTVQLIILV